MKVRFNEDAAVVAAIKEGLEKTGGYCPCRFERTEDTKCVCKAFKRADCRPRIRGILPLSAVL